MHRDLGPSLRPLWALAEDGTFLNHGSFGACPKEVLAEQARLRDAMESQPDAFFRRNVMPETGDSPLRAAAAELARLVGAGDGSLAFVENATMGVQAALRSVALGPGDRVLVTSHQYNAVRLMVEARCAETGAEPAVVALPLGAHADEILARFEAAIVPGVKLAILDHITSATAVRMPIERIVPLLRGHGVRIIVDGAHAVGHIPLDVAALEVDWYVSNAHKWLFAPRGTAFLYASKAAAGETRPVVVSHFVEMGFPFSFDWVGTRDYSAWLAVPAAIRFHARFDPGAWRAHDARIIATATERLSRLGVLPAGPGDTSIAMRSFVLPTRRPCARADAQALMRSLWEGERIQAMAVAFGERLLLRVSSQAYVGEEDVGRLADALDRHGWPARS